VALPTSYSDAICVDGTNINGPHTYGSLAVLPRADYPGCCGRASEETVAGAADILLALRWRSYGRGLPAVAALHHPGLCAWGDVDHMLAHTALDKEALSTDRSVGRGLFRRCEDGGGRGRGGGEPGGRWSIGTWHNRLLCIGWRFTKGRGTRNHICIVCTP